MDVHKIDELNAAAKELEHRRALASARQERESGRKALLDALMEADRQADHLRSWIAGQETHHAPETPGEVSRMLRWAGDELAVLETMTAPAQIAEVLRRQNLFPDVDTLADPQGDPPPLRPWGR
ncbi:MAG: hypothetical protein AB7F74_00445 [Parvibaculaceae bacterium]